MKNYLFIAVFGMLFLTINAQLKVISSGEVTIPLNKSLWITNSSTPSNNGYRLRMFNDGSNAYLDYYDHLYFRSGSSSSANMVTFTSNGKVGIATISPYSTLHVVGNGTFTQTSSSITSAAYIRGLNTFSTSSTPDYTWYNNEITGIFHPISNTIGFSTGGLERVRIDGNGKVGIATPSPYSTFQVAGNSTFTQTSGSITSAAYIRGLNTYSTASTPDYTWYNNDNTGIYHPLLNTLGFSTGGIERVSIDGNGKVGIGITTPTKRFHLKDNDDEIQVFLENDYVAGDNTKSGAGIRFENSNNYNYYLINESSNAWGHTNILDFRNIDNILMQLFPDQHVGINGWLGVDFYIKLFHDQSASYLGAAGYDFNPTSTIEGLILEQRYSEGSGFYADGDFAAIWSPGDQDRLLRVYDEDGMVEKWYVDAAGYEHTNSDSTKKENIRIIENSIDQLKQINGVKFNFKKEENIETENDVIAGDSQPQVDNIFPGDIQHIVENKYDPSQKEYYGFLAQDVEKIFPEIIGTNEKGEMFISYIEFIPILVEAFKEQQSVIDAQSLKIKELEQKINGPDLQKTTLKSKSDNIEAKSASIVSNAFLYQNIPNPFSYNTEIKYFIPDGAINPELYIFTLQGNLLKSKKITTVGLGNTIIYGSELQPGMYVYTLIINGNEEDTKRMILTK